VGSAEPHRGSAGVDVGEQVVGVGDGDLLVLSAVGIRVANKGSLEVVRKLAVADGDLGRSMGDIEEAIVA
jgi:hypothetical protein